LPITILSFVEFEKVRLNDYKKQWKSNLPNVQKSAEIKLNSKILIEPDDL